MSLWPKLRNYSLLKIFAIVFVSARKSIAKTESQL